MNNEFGFSSTVALFAQVVVVVCAVDGVGLVVEVFLVNFLAIFYFSVALSKEPFGDIVVGVDARFEVVAALAVGPALVESVVPDEWWSGGCDGEKVLKIKKTMKMREKNEKQ